MSLLQIFNFDLPMLGGFTGEVPLGVEEGEGDFLSFMQPPVSLIPQDPEVELIKQQDPVATEPTVMDEETDRLIDQAMVVLMPVQVKVQDVEVKIVEEKDFVSDQKETQISAPVIVPLTPKPHEDVLLADKAKTEMKILVKTASLENEIILAQVEKPKSEIKLDTKEAPKIEMTVAAPKISSPQEQPQKQDFMEHGENTPQEQKQSPKQEVSEITSNVVFMKDPSNWVKTETTTIHPSQFTKPEAVAEQITMSISKAHVEGTNLIKLQLNPVELGQVDIHLKIDKDGQINAIIEAQHPETFDLLSRHIPELQKSLQDAGLKGESSNFEFSLKQDTPDQQHHQEQSAKRHAFLNQEFQAEETNYVFNPSTTKYYI